MHGRKFNAAAWPALHSEARRRYLDPERVLDAVGVREGATVAEIGAGSGAFTLPLARRVTERGRVYALDLQPEMLAPLHEAEESGRWPQLVVRESREDRIPVPDGVVDAAFLVHVLHELDGDATLRETHRLLRADGLLHVVDWEPVETQVGPPLDERVAEPEATRFVEQAGFRLVRRFEAGEANYGLSFAPI